MPSAFRGALIVSAALHAALLILIVASPSLSPAKPKGLVQYVNFIGGGGGQGGSGGGGGAAPKPTPLPPAKKESLRDLTTALKAKPEDKAALHYPAEKPKTAKKTPEKKTAISKPAPKTAETAAATTETPTGQETSQGGFGLRFGTGGGTGGGAGTGPGGLGGGGTGGDPFGVSGFPFTYYLQIISDRITANWFSSLVDPGVSGQFQTQVGFRIYRNGQVADLKVEVASGVEAFDLSAQRAIQSAAPFPPLPSEYDGQFLVIHLIFEHAK